MAMLSVTASINFHHHKQQQQQQHHQQEIKTRIERVVGSRCPPLESLEKGSWVKLICGASYEDVLHIRNLSLVYALAGVDCIDCAADASVVSAVNQGIQAASNLLPLRRPPWVMISVNDRQDLHFRKAEFDPQDCPLDCSRPCHNACPANAIPPVKGGVITERCYGCGRCFPVCPYDQIREVNYVRDAATTIELLRRNDVDAVEIHTSGRQTDAFKLLWNSLGDCSRYLRLTAISLPDLGDSTVPLMDELYNIMRPNLHCDNLWQLDGRPMSGDIGRGATRKAISFAVRLAAAKDRPQGFLQLAGGTNAHTVAGLKKEGLFQTIENKKDATLTSQHSLISGVAYGGYARKIVGRILSSMQSQHGVGHIEHFPEYLDGAVVEALGLVGTSKCYDLSLL